jgi:predicted nucleic acid-binding protein
MVIVDTSAWVEFFRRQGDPSVKLAVKGLLDAYEATLCGPVEMEFLGGARPEEKDRIQSWFGIVPYARNDQKIWRKAATLYSRMNGKGFKVPWNDALIACITIEKGCRVYAVDKHFEAMSRFAGLRLYHPGYNGSFNPESDSP